MEQISQGFAEYSHGRMHGCIMAIDGLLIRTRCPTRAEVVNQRAYINRKDCYGILVFAGCDHKCRFTMFAANFPGATNDSLAWPMTRFHNEVVAAERLPRQYYIVCDKPVSCTNEVLSPYGGRQLGTSMDSFNYHLSSMRQCIERSFGIRVQRWGILWRDLVCAESCWSLVVTVCARLHNLCIDFGQIAGTNPNAGRVDVMPEDFEEDDTATAIFNEYSVENGGEMPRNAHNSSIRRINITNWLRDQGYVRPAHSMRNSKA